MTQNAQPVSGAAGLPIPQYVQSLMNSAPGSIQRRYPADWSDGEGGIDFGAPTGTPVIALADGVLAGAGYFCNASGSFFLQSDSGACDHGVVTTRVTNQDGTQTDLYYQHIILNPGVRLCANGISSCGGQVIKKGDVIGYISDFGMLEMGVNVGNPPNKEAPYPNGWGGIWGADPAPGPHVDPERYLRALISGQNTTGTLSGTGIGGSFNFSPASFLPQAFLDWIGDPLRMVKLVVGVLLIALSLVLLMVPQAEDNAKKLIKFAEDNPELLA
jgi:hypothetical protein